MTGEDKEFIRVKEGIMGKISTDRIQTLAGITILTLQSTSFTIGDGKNIAVGTSTGTKIGTSASQKIAFYDSTPIVQAVLATSASNSDIVTALQNLGLVRQS